MQLMNPKAFERGSEEARSPRGTFPPKKVEVNEAVVFFEQAHRGAPKQGFVVAVSQMGDGSPGPCISVNVLDGTRIRRVDSVRHIDDPDAQIPTLRHNGAWDYAPLPGYVNELIARVDAIETKLGLSGEKLIPKAETPEPVRTATVKGGSKQKDTVAPFDNE